MDALILEGVNLCQHVQSVFENAKRTSTHFRKQHKQPHIQNLQNSVLLTSAKVPVYGIPYSGNFNYV